ncbi:MAG: DUF255 domain-containing protein [Nitrospirae bacterium]|nr:MAG: DUF255 domain-containing protein [Nitrospirota bacterium]
MAIPHTERRPNRLIHETSPYLLQHAYNPVDWYPWGEEALRRAKEENKPILLSIGYSACHWCHVMEKESFEDENIAAIMNANFINIKVDREERPDLDEIYMQATVAMNQGHGGWPMTVFLTPDQEPIFAGTYFPPTDKWGRPGFVTILRNIADAWTRDRDTIVKQAARFTERLRSAMQQTAPMAVGQTEIDAAVQQFARQFDARYGGFGPAPKFPPATGLSFLLRQYVKTQDARILKMVTTTLDTMAAGGLYDHIGGGFARYSTDERWLVPHFEKMLYDNALLAHTYLEAYQVTGDLDYRRVTTETLDYILREMTAPEGGFYSATDADSEGVEGKYFVWTPEQVREALGNDEDTRWFCAYYDITPDGNWEGVSIPHTPKSIETVAHELGCSPEDLQRMLERTRPLIYEARRKRVPPALDDKIITAWNGMMISAMAEAGRVLGTSRYRDAAIRAADFLLCTMTRPDSRLYRTYRAGRAQHEACLEDYAYLAEGLIDLYEAVGEERYVYEAVALAERILEDFADPEHGGFFTTGRAHEPLIVRAREGQDGATPSGNAVAASALARLSCHFGREDFRNAAVDAIRVWGRHIAHAPRAFAKSLMVVDYLLQGPVEIALVGEPGASDYEQLYAELGRRFIPYRIIAYRHDQESEPAHPLLKGKSLIHGRAAVYLCRNFACQAPITDPQSLASALASGASHSPPTPSARTLTARGHAGHATPAGTAAYVARMLGSAQHPRPAATGYTSFGATGLTVSRIGFGGYRIDDSIGDYQEALAQALRRGINLIDTSTNYADGESERVIGRVLADLIKGGAVTREEIVVVSKIGYAQGQALVQAQTREQAGNPYPDMVKYGENLWHCLHPEFLADQLTRSLDRLGLQTLDVCLLHNPEYFLADAKKRRPTMTASEQVALRQEFSRRLQHAFAFFEQQVASGRLRYYGVSSNTCTAHPEDIEATSLSCMLEAATAAANALGASAHHFAVLQLPLNLLEPGALLTPNTGSDHRDTVLELAQRAQIAVLVNRPLNAIAEAGVGLIRLADPRAERPQTTFEHQRTTVQALEEEYQRTIAPLLPRPGEGVPPSEYFAWATELDRIRSAIHNLEHWEHVEAQMIAPHLSQVFQVVTRYFAQHTEHQADWDRWRERYIPELLTLLNVLRMEAAQKSAAQIHRLRQAIDPFLPESHRNESFARKALWIVASTPGVTSVLNGMRRPHYVDDAITVLSWPPLVEVRPIYEAAARTVLTDEHRS